MSAERVKLTKRMRALLAKIAAGERHTPERSSITNPTASALSRRGLLKWKSASWFGGSYEITDAGRTALAGDL